MHKIRKVYADYEHAFDDLGAEAKERRRRRSVTRPNWLKITVGRISDRFVVVMIEDLSDVIRFAQTRDSFITNVSEQLLKPTEALMNLADSLEQGGGDRERIARDARQVRTTCGHLNRMVSDLLLLIKAQEPITPSAANVIALREPLEAVRQEIGTTVRAAAEVRIAEIDLARTGAAEELHAFTEREGIAVDVLINNAGIFSFLDILRTPAERIERIILLHDLTNTQLCRLYAADMACRGRGGHILNMSSYSLWMPFPGLSLYSASKAYLRAFSVAFAKEVRDEGIRVTAVCPAGVATDLYGLTPRWQRIGLRLGVLISADSCARRGLRALWRGRRTIVPDWWNRIWIPLCKLLPMQAIRPLRRFTMRFQR